MQPTFELSNLNKGNFRAIITASGLKFTHRKPSARTIMPSEAEITRAGKFIRVGFVMSSTLSTYYLLRAHGIECTHGAVIIALLNCGYQLKPIAKNHAQYHPSMVVLKWYDFDQ